MRESNFNVWAFIYFLSLRLCLVFIDHNNCANKKEIITTTENYQTTIDSLINKNQRLNDGFIRLYDDWSEVQVENDKLARDNKYLRRITR